MLYRLQDHAMDLHRPNSTSDMLMVVGEETMFLLSSISQNIPKADLLKLMLLTWLTNYEKEHFAIWLTHMTTPPKFFPLADGIVKTIFKHPEEERQKSLQEVFRRPTDIPSNSTIYHSMMMMPIFKQKIKKKQKDHPNTQH